MNRNLKPPTRLGQNANSYRRAKKLLDTSHPVFKADTAVRSRIINYWKGVSLPYPEPGVRLIRQDDIETLNVHLTTQRGTRKSLGGPTLQQFVEHTEG